MYSDDIKAIFDKQASSYDEQSEKTAPIRDGLLFLAEAVFAELPPDARILCVGAGTGEEIAYFAKRFPQWSFAAVEPSGPMLDQCRKKAEKQGFDSRCYFHEGYLETLPIKDKFEAATCFLVSQFILERKARTALFRTIASKLQSGGVLASSDLASELGSESYEALLRVWQHTMTGADATPEGLERMRSTYANDLAVRLPVEVASIIKSGGFEAPVQFYQAGLVHAWFCKRAPKGT